MPGKFPVGWLVGIPAHAGIRCLQDLTIPTPVADSILFLEFSGVFIGGTSARPLRHDDFSPLPKAPCFPECKAKGVRSVSDTILPSYEISWKHFAKEKDDFTLF